MSSHRNLPAVFAGILADLEQQPLVLHRAAVKANPRRFSGDPVTAFGGLSEERRSEIRADELADQRADEQRERDEAGL